jgi:hypothetical protein
MGHDGFSCHAGEGSLMTTRIQVVFYSFSPPEALKDAASYVSEGSSWMPADNMYDGFYGRDHVHSEENKMKVVI